MDSGIISAIMHLVLKSSLQAVILTAIVWAICRIARNAPASFRCALWILVLVKLFVPPVADVPAKWAFWQHKERIAVQAPAPVYHYAPVLSGKDDLPPASREIERARPQRSLKPAPAPYLHLPSIPEIFFMLWMAGVGVMAIRLILRTKKQKMIAAGEIVADEDLMDQLENAVEALKVGRLPGLLCSDNVSTPTLVGLFRPTIVLPRQVMESCGRDDIKAMLLHELAHIKRRDMSALWFYEIARMLFFFNPAVWVAGRQIEIERELACDEMVVKAGSISAAEYAAGYVASLKLARQRKSVQFALGMAEPFEVGKMRVEMILRKEMPKFSPRWVMALGLLAAVGLPTFAGVADEAIKPKTHSANNGPNVRKIVPAPVARTIKEEDVLNGLAEAKGSGIVVTLDSSPKLSKDETDPSVIAEYEVHDSDIRAVVNTLFAAGAKAIAVEDQRISAMSAIRCVGPAIMVNNTRLVPPYKIIAIGNPPALEQSIMAKDSVTNDLILLEMIKVKQKKELQVTALPVEMRSLPPAGSTARGTGVIVTIKDSPKLSPTETKPEIIEQFMVHSEDIQTVVNELKAAGAAAISVNGYRWTAVSSLTASGPVILMDGNKLAPPYVIRAIGNAAVLDKSITMPGGVAKDLFLLDMISVRKNDNLSIGGADSGTEWIGVAPTYQLPAQVNVTRISLDELPLTIHSKTFRFGANFNDGLRTRTYNGKVTIFIKREGKLELKITAAKAELDEADQKLTVWNGTIVSEANGLSSRKFAEKYSIDFAELKKPTIKI